MFPFVSSGQHRLSQRCLRRFCHDYSVLMDLLALNPFSVRSLILAQSLWLVKTRICIFIADVIACSSALGLALRSFSIFSGRISATGLPVSDSSLIICRTIKESRDLVKIRVGKKGREALIRYSSIRYSSIRRCVCSDMTVGARQENPGMVDLCRGASPWWVICTGRGFRQSVRLSRTRSSAVTSPLPHPTIILSSSFSSGLSSSRCSLWLSPLPPY